MSSVEYYGLTIREDGKVFHKDGTPYRFHVDKKGYYYIVRSGKRQHLHRLMPVLFYSLDVKGFTIHHLDHDKHNNNLSNLLVCTREAHDRIHQLLG